MFEIDKSLSRPNIPRTIRFTEELFDSLLELSTKEKSSTCAVAIWLGAAIKQQKYNSHILPSAL